MDIDNIKKGLHDLFPLFHIIDHCPAEHVFDIKTQEVLATFLMLENIKYKYPLYVKIDLRTGLLSECYPMFYRDFETSIDCLNGKSEIGNAKSYFSLPIKFENGEYSFEYSNTYDIYSPTKKVKKIIRKRDGVVNRSYFQCKDFTECSFPLYWKTRDLIINSDPDYMIFYFKGEEEKNPDKILLGINVLNANYPKVSKLINALRS